MKLCKDLISRQINLIFCLKKIPRREYFAIKMLFECRTLSVQKQISTFRKTFSILKKIKEKELLPLNKQIVIYCKKLLQSLILPMGLNPILREATKESHFNKKLLHMLIFKMISIIF
jgi:hypothetical protein